MENITIKDIEERLEDHTVCIARHASNKGNKILHYQYSKLRYRLDHRDFSTHKAHVSYAYSEPNAVDMYNAIKI